jgi:CRP/FNR family transcriptional regulator, cyclic AMP receptor protein
MGPTNNLIPPSELQTELESLATIVFKPAGSLLFQRGDETSGVFLIRSGRISLALDYEIPVYPARILGPGALIGLPATVSGKPYSLTAKVVEDSELGFVPRAQVLECLKKNPLLCFQVMDILSDEIADVRSAFERNGLGVRAARERVEQATSRYLNYPL